MSLTMGTHVRSKFQGKGVFFFNSVRGHLMSAKFRNRPRGVFEGCVLEMKK